MSNAAPFAHMIPSQALRWVLLGALLGAGLLGNYFKYPLFFEIDFLFGSIFSFLILQFFGRAYGIGAALLISGVTYFIWGHPYAMIIMTAELAFVALLTGRYKISLVFADAMYWVLLGMPMVYVFYHGVMDVPEAVTTITLTKQAVNGITNVLIARLIFTLIGFRATVFSITLREILHTCMVLCVALPMLLLIIIDSRSEVEKGIAQTQLDLKNEALKINKAVQLWIKNRDAGLKNLASVAQLGDASRTQAALDQHRNSDLNLLRVGLLSPSFISTLFSPTANEQGRSNIGIDFSDLPLVPLMREQAKPMLSDIMLARIGSAVPIVAIVHPVIKDDQVKGYIAGVLSLEQVTQLIATSVGTSDLRFTLLDRGSNVIVTNRADQKPMTPFALGEGNLNKIDDSISQWIPKIRANAPFFQRFRQSYYLNESTLGINSDWRLMLELPVGPMQKALSETYTKRLTLLLILLLLGTVLSEVVSRQILKVFDALRESTSDLPGRLASGKKVDWPKSQMLETQSLITNFQGMARSLQIEFAATRDANALLEERVASRTKELTASNAKLELLEVCVSRLNDIVLITEAEPFDQPGHRIVFVNDAFTRRTGYSREEVIGQTPRILQGPKTQRSELDRIGAALRRWEPVRAELINYTKAGQEFWIELDIVPIANEQGWHTHWVAVERDITERKLAELKRESLEAQLRESQKMEAVGTLAGGIAHDFNNILGAILGNAELARQDAAASPEALESLAEIRKAGLRARELVQQILSFSRRQPTVRRRISLAEAVQESTRMLRSIISAQISIEFVLAADAPQVVADPTQIQQVLINLVTNAAYAMHGRGGLVSVRVDTVDLNQFTQVGTTNIAPGRYACLTVADTGSGMDEATLSRVFEPFFTTKPAGEGTGLGLAVVHGIVQSNDGQLAVTSKPGVGTTFKLYLREASAADAATVELLNTRSTPDVMGHGQHILYLDDDESMVSLVERFLQRRGYRVSAFTEQSAALNALRGDPFGFSLLVTDYNMPGMSGLEVAREALAIRTDLAVALSSGYITAELRESAAAIGIHELIFKPNAVEEFCDVIQRLLMPDANARELP